jgi:signal transduction histidine kinase/DNA-binding NarL/FixJ family response regulator
MSPRTKIRSATASRSAPKLLVLVVTLALTLGAIAGVWGFVDRASAAHEAELQVSALKLALADLQSAPFSADPLSGGSAPLVQAEIHADEAALSRGLTVRAQVDAPASLLASGRNKLALIESVVSRVYRISTHGGLTAAGALVPKLNGALVAASAAVSSVLRKIATVDAARSARARIESKLGAAAAMLLLLIAFAYFYVRSAVAQVENDAILRKSRDEARWAAEVNAAARNDAVEASNAKSVFVATVSHELRTPLSGVIGTTGLLLETNLDVEQHEYAEIIRSSSEGLLLVINDILDYSKIEAGKLELDPSGFALSELIAESCALLLPTARRKGIELDVEAAPGLPGWLHGDAGRLRQVLINLLSNAVKFTDAGQVTVHVSATVGAKASLVRVEVRDTGIGIDNQTLARLFQPFTQADGSTARKYGGTGLGLTISKRLIEMMGGTIGAHSVPGEGSTFWFEVPIPVADQGDQATRSPVRFSARGGRHGAGNLRDDAPLVLVAEDSPVNQMLATRALDKCGYRSEVVGNGRMAVDATEHTRYAAVLMDCQMPEMDGYEATGEIRRRETKLVHLPIIAVTAHSMNGDREKCLAAGMDVYLSKPIRISELSQALSQCIASELDPDEQTDLAANQELSTHQGIAADRLRR